MGFEEGTKVKVVEYGGRVLERRVVADRGERIVICPEAEYMAAKSENRSPVGISFPRTALTVGNES